MVKKQLRLFFHFLKFIFPYRKQWFLVLLSSSILALLSVINPYLAKLVVDEGINKKDLNSFLVLILMGAGIFVATGLVNGLKDFQERYIKTRVGFDLTKKLLRQIQGLSLNQIRRKATGEQIYLFDYDVNTVTDFIAQTLPQTLFLFPKLLLTLAIIFYLNWKIALFSLCLSPLLYLPALYFCRRIQKNYANSIEISEGVFKNLEELFSHIQLIKSFHQELSSIRMHLKKIILSIRLNIRNIKLEILNLFAVQLTTKIISGLIGLYGGYLVIKGKMSLGNLTAVTVYLYQLQGLQTQFTSFFETVAVGTVSCQRIKGIFEEKPNMLEVVPAKELLFRKGKVSYKNVSFGYIPQVYVLKNISFEIEGGSHIVFVGPSGCGKTTLLNLLIRLYDPWQGEIFIDDFKIKEGSFRSLKSQIGIALQQPLLWNDTIENNIKYGQEDANSIEMLKVSEICGLDDLVRNLEQGYKTIIGEDAYIISEGQKQRIALARALVGQPKILILDEAMSSLDSKSEEEIILNIKRNHPTLTLIVVSHRLSTVVHADLAYYLCAPQEMIIGKARNLLENNKDFAKLFSGQERISV